MSNTYALKPAVPVVRYENVKISDLILTYKTAYEDEGFIMREPISEVSSNSTQILLTFDFYSDEIQNKKEKGVITIKFIAMHSATECLPCYVSWYGIVIPTVPEVTVEDQGKLYAAMHGALERAEKNKRKVE